MSIVFRGDSGFAREAIFAWCERNRVEYVVGLARNARLERRLEPAMERAEERCAQTGKPARLYEELRYRTRETWSRSRRVVGKAEITQYGPNPRFIVTSLSIEEAPAKKLYEQLYCARGDMENRIKEQQLDLFATRTSGSSDAGQPDATVAVERRLHADRGAPTNRSRGYRSSPTPTAARFACDCSKIGARVRVTVRKVWVSLASSHPAEPVFAHAYERLFRAAP